MSNYEDKLEERSRGEYEIPANIVLYPDKRLRITASPVTNFDMLGPIIEEMVSTMYAAQGVGLAGPQIGLDHRIIVIDAGTEDSEQITAINPVIVAASGGYKGEEGCLSIPGYRADVQRAAEVTVEWDDVTGQRQRKTVGDFEAIIWQHEIDHLDGILFPDRLGPLKRKDFLKRFGVEKRKFSKPKSLFNA